MRDSVVYFDNINTTFPHPDVVSIVETALKSAMGNPSSHIHSYGIAASRIIDESRERVASFVNSRQDEIIFTSGATESNNIAIAGFLNANPKIHLAVSCIEHFSILNQAKKFGRLGRKVSFIDVDNFGRLDLSHLERVLELGPTLVSVAYANPEIGTVQDVESIGRCVHRYGAIFHCDATAAASTQSLDVEKLNIDLLTLSGHNMYGVPGTGALYINAGTKMAPLFDGGNQEFGIRPGTENIMGIAAIGKACEIVKANRIGWNEKLRKLGRQLRDEFAQNVPFIHFTGHPEQRLPGHISFWIEHIEGESLLLLLNMNNVMAASGSACSSNLKGVDEHDLVASHVLSAVGVPSDICAGSLTFSLGWYSSLDEVTRVSNLLPQIVQKLLAMSPSYSDYMKSKEALRGK